MRKGKTSSIKTFKPGLFVLFLFFYIEAPIAEEREEEPDVVLPEVVVEEPEVITYYGVEGATTATKTDTPVEEIPQSIEVINRDVIEDQGAVRLQDIIYNVSGAVPGESTSNLVPFLLRGFGAEILRNGFVQSKSLFLGIFQEELANVERVEFLKRPASVLYGNTAPGGVINIITKKPLLYFYASAEMTAGSYSFYRPALDASVPLIPDRNLLFRFNASYLNSDSFRDFISSERVFLAPVMSWEIPPNMTLTLESEYFYADQPVDEGLVAYASYSESFHLLLSSAIKVDGKGIFDGFGVGAGLIAVGDREGDLPNTFNLDGFVRLDAALYYSTQIRRVGKVNASINFKNITDKDYIQNSTSRVNIIPGEPFTVLASLRLEL